MRNTNSLVRVVDVLVLSDLVVVGRLRGVATLQVVLTSLVNLSRGQLLKGNSGVNRLVHIIVDLDFDLDGTVGGLRAEGLRASAHNGLAVSLIDQLRGQGVLLARNQALVINGVDHSVASSNFSRAICELRVGRDARLKHSADRLVLIFDVFVFGDVIGLLAVGLFTSSVDLLRSQTLECNRRLNRVLCAGHSDLDLDVTVDQLALVLALVVWDHEGHRAITKDVVRILLIDELRIQRVALTRNQAVVVHSVHNGVAVLNNVHPVLEIRNGANFRVRVEALLDSGSHSLRGRRRRLNRRNRLFLHDKGLSLVSFVLVLHNLSVVNIRIRWFAVRTSRWFPTVIERRCSLEHNIGRPRFQISQGAEVNFDRAFALFTDSFNRGILGSSDSGNRLTIDLVELAVEAVLRPRSQTRVLNRVLNLDARSDIGRRDSHLSFSRGLPAIHRHRSLNLPVRIRRSRSRRRRFIDLTLTRDQYALSSLLLHYNAVVLEFSWRNELENCVIKLTCLIAVFR